MIAAQGGDPACAHDPSRLKVGPAHVDVTAGRAGFVGDIDPLELGLVGVAMGAGRTRADQAVDHAVGIEILTPLGTKVDAQQPVARIWVRTADHAQAHIDRVRSAFRVVDTAPATSPLMLERIGS